MIFDLVCYALAIAATLAFVGGNRAPQQRPIHRTLETLHAIGEALPAEVFATDTEAATVPDMDLPDYDELFAQADEIGDRHSTTEPATDAPEQDDFADLLAISAPAQGIDTRWLATYGTHALRTLGVVEGITGARRWAKAQAVSSLTSHYALA